MINVDWPSLSPAALWRSMRNMQSLGILGMNKRNHRYIAAYNPRRLFPLVDDKLQTKELALESKVTTPGLIAVIENQHDSFDVAGLVKHHRGFCIKPAKGSGGKGILVIKDSAEGRFQRANGQWMSAEEIQRHVSNILAGLFSLGGATDVAMIEELIVPSQALAHFAYQGVPDIRVIVFRGIPVMAMIRLPCASSHGKANLHQGAIGVGLDLGSGTAINAVQRERCISVHPDNQIALSELTIPHWQNLLRLSVACADMSGLGYMGVDLVVDEHSGPTLLELNARPGLSIQIANAAGLLPRLRKIEALRKPERMSTEDKVAFAQTHFSKLPAQHSA